MIYCHRLKDYFDYFLQTGLKKINSQGHFSVVKRQIIAGTFSSTGLPSQHAVNYTVLNKMSVFLSQHRNVQER